jgi:type IV secretory pathway VirD2 relaxase
MILRDDDRPIRLRPCKPPVARRERTAWAGAYRLVTHYARGMRKLANSSGAGGGAGSKPHRQRCAVRITYLNNRTRGQWRAHGRYLAREGATAGKSNEVGFNRDRSGIDVTSELRRWQSSGDPRLWKVILSPEFGDRIDLQRLTRDLVDRMALDLGTDLEWIGVAHHNTEHPHVHIVIRGIRSDRQPIHLRAEYLKHGIREIAQDLCTRQIGYRTAQDATEAERREIGEHRLTSLDRAILRMADYDVAAPDGSFIVVRNSGGGHVGARLAVLRRMGLAESKGPNTWNVRRGFDEILRAMQRAADRQKTLAAHGVPISDDRLPIEALDMAGFTAVEGRILVHGQDEHSGRNYLMLEGTDAKVYFIEYTPEMEVLRADGGLRTNSFLRLRKLVAKGQSIVHVQDLGDSEKVLANRVLLGEKSRALLQHRIFPTEDGWGGWLGRYQAALVRAAKAVVQNRERHQKSPARKRDLPRGH